MTLPSRLPYSTSPTIPRWSLMLCTCSCIVWYELVLWFHIPPTHLGLEMPLRPPPSFLSSFSRACIDQTEYEAEKSYQLLCNENFYKKSKFLKFEIPVPPFPVPSYPRPPFIKNWISISNNVVPCLNFKKVFVRLTLRYLQLALRSSILWRPHLFEFYESFFVCLTPRYLQLGKTHL